MNDIKICKYCNLEKEISLFLTANQCKECRKIKQKEYNNLPENKERFKLLQAEYRKNNRESIRQGRNDWAARNREKDNNYKRKYRKNNKEKEYEYQRNRRKTNINYKLVGNLRHRIWMALEGNVKSSGTKKLLGCSIEFFKSHLEKQFIDGMSWENYGENGWHVGHIIPCKFFDLSNPKEQEICFHHTNLRPEWEMDNIKNNDKLPCGRRARDFSREEKFEYLKNKGFNI